MKTYIYYDPRNNNKIMGQSTEKNVMDFPYVEDSRWYNVLQHVKVDDLKGEKRVKIDVGYWNDPRNINLKLIK